MEQTSYSEHEPQQQPGAPDGTQQPQYPPFKYQPMRMRGIFGATFSLFKRGFFPLLGFMLVILAVPIILGIVMMGSFASQGVIDAVRNQSYQSIIALVFRMLGFLLFFGLAGSFLIAPAINSTVYLEMQQRMDGRRGTFTQLFRYALPAGFKRLYTTHLSLLLVNLGISIVMSIVASIITPMFAAGMVSNFLITGTGITNPRMAVLTLLPVLLVLIFIFFVLGMISELFPSLVLPAAIHERTRAFTAVGRSFSLVGRRFGRALGATALFNLILLGFELVVVLLYALLLSSYSPAVMVVGIILFLVAQLLVVPYTAAFHTVLYADLSARDAERRKNAASRNAQQTPPYNGALQAPQEQPPYGPQSTYFTQDQALPMQQNAPLPQESQEQGIAPEASMPEEAPATQQEAPYNQAEGDASDTQDGGPAQ